MAASYGGPSHALGKMQTALKQRGIVSSVAAIYDPKEGDLVMPAGDLHLFPKEGPPFYYYSRSLQFWLRGQISNYDLVHIHSMFSYPALIAGYYARNMRKPYILRPFGTLDRYCMGRHFLRKRVYFELCERRNLDRARVIHCTSLSEKEEIARFNLKPRSVVIPLGVDTVSEPFLKRTAKNTHVKSILFLSRIDPKKGLELLIRAIAMLKETRQDFCLLVAGSGKSNYLAMLKKSVRDLNLENHIRFLGAVGGDKKDEALRIADIFVLPSYRENFGLAVAEAMAAGCPVVISDQVAIHREVADYGAGVITSLSPDDISRKLNNLLNNENARLVMGQRGQELVRDRFNLESNVQKLILLYEDILNNESYTH